MERKHALLIFSKPPVAGMVKTRLTTQFGGILTPAEAAELFKRTLYDVSENCMQAMMLLAEENKVEREENPDADVHSYDFFVSTTPADNKDLMIETFEDIGPWPCDITYITDAGENFDDHFDDAFKQIFDRGYESIVSVGGDIPLMPRDHVMTAFRWLHYFADTSDTGGFVQAPCQECGVSLVGFTNKTPMDHQGIYYNMTGRPALDGYIQKAEKNGVPMVSLMPVADIDTTEDLAHAISLLKANRYSHDTAQSDLYVSQRTLDWVEWKGITVSTPPNDNHDPRQYIDE